MSRMEKGFAAIAEALTRRAENLARVRGELRLRAERGDHSRWRQARLLWPHFTDRSS